MSAEALLDWIGSAKKDLLAFPEPVAHAMGYALGDVLHAFQKKSTRAIKTAQADTALIGSA